jgi:hypothetical protein
MNDELKGVWKDVVVPYFEVISQHSFRKPTKDIFHGSHYLSRDTNETPLEYKLPHETSCFSAYLLVL